MPDTGSWIHDIGMKRKSHGFVLNHEAPRSVRSGGSHQPRRSAGCQIETNLGPRERRFGPGATGVDVALDSVVVRRADEIGCAQNGSSKSYGGGFDELPTSVASSVTIR